MSIRKNRSMVLVLQPHKTMLILKSNRSLSEHVARGVVRLSSSNKEALNKRFKDVEDQLINSKLALAQVQAEKFDLQNEVDMSGSRLDKLRQEMKALEDQLVQTKISLAEAQVRFAVEHER